MRVYSKYGKVAILAATLLLMNITPGFARTNVDYRFKVKNGTRMTIKKLLVSEDGKKWSPFDIGSGVAPGATEEMVWDKSTDDGACEWWVKAVYSNGQETEKAKFDFCEKDLVLEFT